MLEYTLERQVKTDWQRLAQRKGKERPWELNSETGKLQLTGFDRRDYRRL